MSTSFQLSRMGFHPKPNLSYETLSDDGKQIYMSLAFRYGLKSALIRTVKDLAYFVPDAVLVDRDYDVLATLCSIGYLDSSLEEDPNWIDSEDWLNCDYSTLFVLFDDSGADYSHVWGLSWGTIPHIDRPVDLIWKNHKLLV